MGNSVSQYLNQINDKRTVRALIGAFAKANGSGVVEPLGTTQANGAKLLYAVNAVVGADGTKGVILPTPQVGDPGIWVVNVTAAVLKIWPDVGGAINALGANNAYSLAASQSAFFINSTPGQWYTGIVGATSADIAFLTGSTAGTAQASKCVVLGASGDIDLIKFGAIGASDSSLGVDGQQAAQGGAIVITGGTSTTAGNAGGAATVKGGTPGSTGVGGAATLQGAAGGSASGAGGAANVTAGAGTAGNANGGSVVLTPGAKNGTGADGVILARGILARKQGAPTAKTVSATLTAAEIAAKIITVNQGAAGTSALQLPQGSALDTAFPDMANDDSFDFSVINTSTVDAEDATVTVNTNVTIVGSPDIPAYSAAGSLNSSALFRLRKTAATTWVCYRIG